MGSVAWRRATPNAVFSSMVVGGRINGLLMVNTPAYFSGMPPYYVGWIGFGLAIVILLAGSLVEGESLIQANATRRAMADGGVSSDEDLEERAQSSMEKIHY